MKRGSITLEGFDGSDAAILADEEFAVNNGQAEDEATDEVGNEEGTAAVLIGP